MSAARSCLTILSDLIHLLWLDLRSRSSLAAENLFLRKLNTSEIDPRVRELMNEERACIEKIVAVQISPLVSRGPCLIAIRNRIGP